LHYEAQCISEILPDKSKHVYEFMETCRPDIIYGMNKAE